MIIVAPSVSVPVADTAASAVPARAPLPGVPLAPLPAAGARSASLAFSAGQTLAASVLRGGQPGANVLLQVDGKPVEARTTLSLAAGQQLNLSVSKTGAETVLQIVGSQAATRATVSQGLRVALPRSAPVLPLLESLAAVTESQARPVDARLPPGVQNAARAVLAALPDRQSLEAPDGLRRALLESGNFMESRAARQPLGQALPQADLKGALVRLANAIREQLPSGARAQAPVGSADAADPAGRTPLPDLAALGKASEGAIYRIQSQQLQQIAARAEQPGMLALEVPVRGEQQFEVLRLRVGEDGSRGGEAEGSVWQVVVDLDLGTAGALQAHVTLRGGDVSTTLRVEQPATAAMARERLAELGARMEEAGLRVGSLACLNAAPLPPAGDTADGGPLLEVEA